MGMHKASLVWDKGPVAGEIDVAHGDLGEVRIGQGRGQAEGARFSVSSAGACRIEIRCDNVRVGTGGGATRVAVRTQDASFTFFLRDVCAEWPIFLPWCGAAVTAAGDRRSFAEIAAAIEARGLTGSLERLEAEAEETYERAAERTRDMPPSETWLGLSRDERLFRVKPHPGYGIEFTVEPRFHDQLVTVPVEGESEDKALCHRFVLGRGTCCEIDMTRCLEDGCLPILSCAARDGEIVYDFTAFVTNEKTPLSAATLRGTPCLVADGHARGHMFTEAQQTEFDRLATAEKDRGEEVVLHIRGTAANTSRIPRYAWFRVPSPDLEGHARGFLVHTYYAHEAATGFGTLKGREQAPVTCVNKLNGRPVAEVESGMLVRPGEALAFEFAIPHQPLPRARAEALALVDVDARLAECRSFWQEKLRKGAQIHLPEQRVDKMVRAGLLHLDLVTCGMEPDGTLAPTIGWYAPIGTESAPIIMFFDSMGWHDEARRAIGFFLDKQHDDGFIQNFNGYTCETGAVLYVIGEHYRYTRDAEWLRRIMPKALLSCDYLLDWRRRNMREEYRDRGFGMLEGKVGDPNDVTHYFFNSGYACAGLQRLAESLAAVDADEARRLATEASAFREDIRAQLATCMARSPVVPLADGTWCPTAPPWAEATGPRALFCDGEPCFTHGAFTARDSLVGALWLVFQGILDASEPMAEWLLRSHAELFTARNVAFTQPYYSRHPHAHLRRSEVNAFLKAYYNGFAGLADRETYTWWEHYFCASPHKTHEEAWFLMQTRWMLLLEEGEALHLLRGVPRAWLADGQRIEIQDMATYFGPVSLRVESRLQEGAIEASYACAADRRPGRLALRLPHPKGVRARAAEGGTYDAQTETVDVVQPAAAGKVIVRF